MEGNLEMQKKKRKKNVEQESGKNVDKSKDTQYM